MKKKNTITIEDLHNLIEDEQTDNYILLTQIMDYLRLIDNKKYILTLKKIGKFVDDARFEHGMRQVWTNRR